MPDNDDIVALVDQAQFYFDRARDPFCLRPEPQAYYRIQDFEEARMFLAAAGLDPEREESWWALDTTKAEFSRLLDESRRQWDAVKPPPAPHAPKSRWIRILGL